MTDDTEVTAHSGDTEREPLDSLDLEQVDSRDSGGDLTEDDVNNIGTDGIVTDGIGTDGIGTDDIGTEANGASASRRATGSRVRLLEREGEVAADFLERLLDIADLDGDIEVDIDGDRASVAIVDSEDGRVPRRLVGSDGKVLDALQELTRLAVQAETRERSRLMLDIAGHRAQRRTVVLEIARTAIAEVKTTGSRKTLDDMSAFERKIVHDEVAAAGLGSESEGVEPHRHIVVFPV
jgi:spoIIIJ-associated protein